MSLRLSGKVALVTGGGQGFGASICKKLAEEGAKVVIMDLNEKTGQSVASEIPGSTFLRGDVTSQTDWEKALDTAVSTYGKLDIVVNNAGILIVKLATDHTEEDYDRLWRINVKGIFHSAKIIVPYFQKQGGGVFVNTSSVGEIRPRAEGVWYAATKAGVNTATKALAREWGKYQIRFNCVAPTIADTGMYQIILQANGNKDSADTRESMVKNIPLGRFCSTRDVANAVCFLASDEASFITGVQLAVDGGLTI
ncbi:NAD(P)-binding protein [Zopfia rhizophila CBS 207.26]|uniref:NAD(P)-binding protein n=1 Tax=Zopfia rhizophila CBS 207.26 TaxID=1314779 RepID=A0A6A6E1X4_9PEZI|nr:NAD(P)-binding protein [Zopfia rhizophila CBS 207.26]